jgi:tripartite-type tricarboxylate transporter receptor subunit TctC
MMGSRTLFLVIAAQLVAMSGLARGDEVETFAKVHTINLYVGYTPGGSYDFYARLFARHIGKHLPGNPTVVVQNMPGAGGLAAANYLYAVAPRDGTALGMLSQTVAIDEVLAAPGIRYKSAEFNWIGRMTSTIEVTMTWHNSKVKTIEDARTQEVVLASTGPGSALDSYPRILIDTAGVKFKLIRGYKGATEAMLAMENGETDGSGGTWQTLKLAKRDWIENSKIDILVQYTLTRSPDLPNVPTAPELARTPADRRLLEFYLSAAEIGRAFVAPPGLSSNLLSEFREAFTATMQDHELLTEIGNAKIEFEPLSGEELQQLVLNSLSVSPELVARVQNLLQVTK